MRKKLLLWDIDGTMIRAKGTGKRAMNRTFREMFGVEDAFDNLSMAGGLDYNIIFSVFQEQAADVSRLPEFFDAYCQTLKTELSIAELMPGVLQVLQLAEQDARLHNALGTGNLEPGARIKLDLFALNRFFPVGGFSESIAERYQVLQTGVARARSHYREDFAPEQVIVIGDTVKDIEAARRIGAQVAAVKTGGGSHEELAAAKPDLLLDNLADATAFIEWCRI
jgi:phosphoglycolate phosphatase-like HAD superfamily hydrolase